MHLIIVDVFLVALCWSLKLFRWFLIINYFKLQKIGGAPEAALNKQLKLPSPFRTQLLCYYGERLFVHTVAQCQDKEFSFYKTEEEEAVTSGVSVSSCWREAAAVARWQTEEYLRKYTHNVPCSERYRGGVSRLGYRDEWKPALASCSTQVSLEKCSLHLKL